MTEINISSQNTFESIETSESFKIFKDNELSHDSIKSKSLKNNEYCTGCILLNLSFHGFQLNKVIEADGENIDQTMKNLKENMKILDSYVDNFRSLVDERLMSIGRPLNGSKQNSENTKSDNDYTIHSLHNTREFKYPNLELSDNFKRRLTSSSSSSNRPGSSIVNRYSTASSNAFSVVSEYAVKTDSEELISETSDSDQEPLGVTIIEQEEESEYIKIYAKWKTDKYYYSGKVKDISSTENWEVLFDDGTVETVKRCDILQLCLLPEGTEVSVDTEGDGSFLRNFVISEHLDVKVNFGRKPEKGCRVLNKLTGEYFTVTRDRIGIHSAVAKKLMSLFGDVNVSLTENLESGNVSIDNIVSEKRVLKRKRYSQYITFEDIKSKRCPSPSIFNMSTPSRTKSTFPNVKNHVHKTESSLFTHCFFMITGMKDEDETGNDVIKDTLEKIICRHNGCVIEQPTQAHVEKYKNKQYRLILIVLGDVTQTVKFMMALAVGQMPIVNEKWIHECIEQSKYLDYGPFLLFRGISEGQIIPINLTNINQPGIFANKYVLIVTDNVLTFGRNWQYILELSGAETFLMDTLFNKPLISSDSCDFAVVDKDGVILSIFSYSLSHVDSQITNNRINKLKNSNILVLDILYATKCLMLNELIDKNDFIL